MQAVNGIVAKNRRVLVTGGGTFIGDNITLALLAEGADVTVLVRPGNEGKLGALAQRVRWWPADLWDPASMRGRARGHAVVVHTVGSLRADPGMGLTHHRFNFVSTRNVATMCVSDGVPHMILLSAARAPWMSRQYIRSKREAEQYLDRVGVNGTIVRAPLTYLPGESRQVFFHLMTLLGSLPPISWMFLGQIAPMPVDMLARGIAHLALKTERLKTINYASDLRRYSKQRLAARKAAALPIEVIPLEEQVHPFDLLIEDVPFAWTPQNDDESTISKR